jgi:hypothetical protein
MPADSGRPHIIRRRGMQMPIPLRQALSDDNLLGNALPGDSWKAWRTLLLAAMGERLTAEERTLFTQLTGRAREPGQRVEEAAFVVGRRGGKSRALATLASYIAGLCQHSLAPGETGIALCIAPDQRQASICLEYAEAVFRNSPVLSQLVTNRTADTLELTNHINLEVRAASFRRLRGPTYVCVLADEAAFWMSDEYSANPDTEIINAVRPGLATTHGPLIIASSPYAKRGVLWDVHRQHFGADGDPLILVAQGASRTFNPTLDRRLIKRALQRDYAAASAEYLAQFRTDIESFVDLATVVACVQGDLRERSWRPGLRYQGFVDPSGGSSDSMTLAIGHRSGTSGILDVLRERRPPFSPEAVVSEFSAILKSYSVTKVVGDRYAGEWPREQFRKHGISYEPAELPKSAIYQNFLPLLNSRRVELLDVEKLVSQLTSLERRTSRGGRDVIDHPPNAHDDLANAAAGVLVQLARKRSATDLSWIDGKHPEPEADRHANWRSDQYVAHFETNPYRAIAPYLPYGSTGSASPPRRA